MPVANEYIIELPQLTDLLPTKDELLTIINTKISDNTVPEIKAGIDTLSWDAASWYSINDNVKINDTISKFVTSDGDITTSHFSQDELGVVLEGKSWITVKEDGSMIQPHLAFDGPAGREGAVLMYSISPESFDITFTDQVAESLPPAQDIFTHTCSYPVLVNSKIPQCCQETHARTTLYIGIYYDTVDWDWLLNHHTEGTLLTI